MLRSKLFIIPFHFRNAYSTLTSTHAYSQNLFSHFASTKFNISAAHIARMFKWAPHLQRLQTLDKVEQFIDMLNRYGCSQVQIAKIMMTRPQMISTSAERIFEPKIKLLEDFGFQGETLAKLLASNPSILSISLENDLLPKMEFLKNLFQSQEFLIKSLLRAPSIFSYNLEKTLKPSVVFWERWGFQGTELFRLLRNRPDILQRSSLTPAQVDLIREIGVGKESKAYTFIVGVVAISRIETLKAKIENLQLCGLSAEETWQVCRPAPQVLLYSKVRVRETMNFVVKDMELPANYIVKHSCLLHLNLEKIMRPRFLVWQKIKAMNGSSLSLLSVLKMSEERFVRNIIRGHPESTTLSMVYENAISKASNHTKSSIQC
ncbi:transcription termination factor MTERF2, chloroplastic [Cryptomeria japonica]|uniref:transcription termination factor MTERF2, chloroplastic n=1 Tax=Cryptomeria japonica TaxID=3369 RepID=UPI0027DA59FB|nr:transcription termination factor MTERF2, chloroplastic [Cryptomeria japonica]XP_057822479.2 transcription termination factor MTERF2, chloroplastic [Cryptomeria japonica]